METKTQNFMSVKTTYMGTRYLVKPANTKAV